MTTTPIQFPDELDLEQFISDEAHDLRSPFNHIIGFSKMILNTTQNQVFGDIQREDLGTVYRSGLRALMLMNGLIDIARINKQEKGIDLCEIDIRQLWQTSLANWKKFNPDSMVQPEFSLNSESSSIKVDEALLRQVICGFITYVASICDPNAIIRVRLDEMPGTFIFTFTSQGVKVPPSSGLDLRMIGFVNQAIISLHHGQILTAEENDEGAVIQFSLPGEN